jgi:hypothetical protein
MPVSIRRDFHTDLANTIAEEIQYRRSNYYYFLGKVEPWAGGNDSAPAVTEEDSELENIKIRANSLFIKKINAGDISFVSKRYNWISGTVYDVWDHTANLQNSVFYVLTSANEVYKCLSNNGGVASTVEPSGKSFYHTDTADGYIWKYMYSVPSFKVSKFMTNEYIPVQKSLTDNFYSRGAVQHVGVVEQGAGYTDGLSTTITVSGTTTGTGAAGTITVGVGGSITNFTITNGGSGYTSGVAIDVTTAGGFGAVLTPIIVGGIVTGITIINAGNGYVTGEPLSFTVGGAKLLASVNSAGTITGVTIANAGTGYSGAVTLTVNSTSGTGKYGNTNPILTAIVFEGSIKHVNIVDPGIGLVHQTATTISVAGDGTGAVFTPIVNGGKVIDVVIDNPGTGYSYMTLTVVGTGTGAILETSLTTSDYTSTQSIVEQTTIPGAIFHVNVVNGGNNYSPSTTVEIVGDGIGATAVATIVSGVITKITMTSFGSGYTYASVVVTDPLRTLVGNVIDVSAYVCLPPLKGHGYDAVSELYGETLAINSSLRQELALNTLLQDYRQFGIIKNPNQLYLNSAYTSDTSLIAYNVQFSNTLNIVIDEVLLLNNSRFRVISVDGNNVRLQSLGTKLITPLGNLFAESNGTRSYNAIRIIEYPSVNKYSGKLLYVADENPFSFTAEQGIVIKTFLKF